MSFYAPYSGPPGPQPVSLQRDCDSALRNTTLCLHFVFGHRQLVPLDKPRDLPSSTTQVPANSFTSDWQALWTACQNWYDARPLELQPLVDIGSVEMEQAEPGKDIAFPVQLFSNATAVVANIAYHIAVLLLLAEKPRLVKVASRGHCFTSPNWHIRTTAGIATSNRFLEQWDPVVIATLLYVARGMTHPAQQDAIMDCLVNISTDTGINLAVEKRQLQSHWSAARSFEPSIWS